MEEANQQVTQVPSTDTATYWGEHDVAATSLHYEAFGLGSSAYAQFNAMIKR